VGEGEFRIKGDGWAVGATAGLLWKINDQHSVGLTYRSPFSVDFEGDARIKSAPPGLPMDPGPSDARASMQFPQMVAVGYAFRPIQKLKLEADVEWVNWDTLNKVLIHSANPSFDAATAPSATVPFDWKDTFSYRFGTEYQLSEQWTVRAGYVFWDNSVPDSTFSPLLPDSDLHSFACGVGYAAKRWGVDVGYQYNLWESRTVRGSVNSPFVDGKWNPQSHAIILTTWLKF
jgi:long-chain fatty acid transport protein